ncbi:hypothetical protein Palpr_1116 [Paludibacter propionicigenes WB4]|uniref:PqqD family protein n=1 Tax=Paludibacter propionicigenes (strain DSM 17365 / JCM 13257 / WB4) TaxID=694427 RepID=E4T3H0_PALPW|nr:PqqD family protein [Paludibacter propionicigenes]ADQ79264.1 hypothetical protein Palpr_1116 [Paludibacter propionicigenes WB4]
MDIETLYKLKSRFATLSIGSELILVPITANVAKMNELFTLNETGKFIWENIKENTTVLDLENSMIETFSVDNITAKRDIDLFLNKLATIFGQ